MVYIFTELLRKSNMILHHKNENDISHQTLTKFSTIAISIRLFSSDVSLISLKHNKPKIKNDDIIPI